MMILSVELDIPVKMYYSFLIAASNSLNNRWQYIILESGFVSLYANTEADICGALLVLKHKMLL